MRAEPPTGSGEARVQAALELMARFALRTGLSGGRRERRYLWTDAFALCNLLGLARLTRDERHTELALRLIDGVHRTLGKHRPDDSRSGWLSGLDELAGESHPTRGGLRIGKKRPERPPESRVDPTLEWEQDGQYFHYLTKWMHALDQAARATQKPHFNLWARELAEVAYAAFRFGASGGRADRLVWKMSTDLRRPLVTSMGQHDPLDGYVTYSELQATASKLDCIEQGPRLVEERNSLAEMTTASTWFTLDPLGMGGLLTDAFRLMQLHEWGASSDPPLITGLLSAALLGLQEYASTGELRQAASQRLAFRELGLGIGLRAVERMASCVHTAGPRLPRDRKLSALLDTLTAHCPLADQIERFWLDRTHQQSESWTLHHDINEVMLATSLVPDGFLLLEPGRWATVA